MTTNVLNKLQYAPYENNDIRIVVNTGEADIEEEEQQDYNNQQQTVDNELDQDLLDAKIVEY